MSAGPPATGRRTLVKVCGLTRAEDAAWALECGADWLGFVLHAASPRAIEPEAAAAILAALPGAVGVAVIVGAMPAEALALARRAGAARVQLHRVDGTSWPADFPLPCTFALGVGEDGTIDAAIPPAPHVVLLDTADRTLAGGTGRSFPWTAARALASNRHVILAGGLDGDNVAAAIRSARPYGVDAASRLESAPGVKDRERVRRFVAAVRECDEQDRAAS